MNTVTASTISYTLPCHKRWDDLQVALPTVIAAASASPPVEIVVVDYGNPGGLYTQVSGLVHDLRSSGGGVNVRVHHVAREFFHMSHARNCGIRAATGDVVVAFLADQLLRPGFFEHVRATMRPGIYMKWIETFVFNRDEILAAGGFDERMEFYGPEGKELADRLDRRGLSQHRIPDRLVSQIPTPNGKKLQHYRERLSKRRMHEMGMAIWRENQTSGLMVANEGHEWGGTQCQA